SPRSGSWTCSGGDQALQAVGASVTATTASHPARARPATTNAPAGPSAASHPAAGGPATTAYASPERAATPSSARCRRLGGTAFAPAHPHDPASGCDRTTYPRNVANARYMTARATAPARAGATIAHVATAISSAPRPRATATEPGTPTSSIACAVARGRTTL